jgi:hypothetical protein
MKKLVMKRILKHKGKDNLPKRRKDPSLYHLSYVVKALKRKALSVKEELEKLDVCLHYQIYPTIINFSVMANGLKDMIA